MNKNYQKEEFFIRPYIVHFDYKNINIGPEVRLKQNIKSNCNYEVKTSETDLDNVILLFSENNILSEYLVITKKEFLRISDLNIRDKKYFTEKMRGRNYNEQ